MNSGSRKKQFLLLQVNDSLFPIGGYSHSYGLENGGRIYPPPSPV